LDYITLDIKKERINRDLTQQEFADLLGVTRKTIVNYESGGNITISKEKLFKNILRNFDIEKTSSVKGLVAENIKRIDDISLEKILKKFKNIDDDEFALYFDYKKDKILKHPLIKSIIKSEAWGIMEQEMRNLIVETKNKD